MKVEIGTVLKLDTGGFYRVEEFFFEIARETGNYRCVTTLTKLDDNTKSDYPIWMTESMLNDGLLQVVNTEETK